MTTNNKTELALKTVNMIRNWHEKLTEMHTLYVSDLGDMEALAFEIKDKYDFAFQKDDDGKPRCWMPLIKGDDPNAWHHEGAQGHA